MKAVTATVNTQDGQEEQEVRGKAEKKAGKRIGYNYIIIKSLKESNKNDVVKCLYIKSLTKWGFCVIKEGTYGDTKDVNGRDIKDRLIWQKQLHELLQEKVPLPRFLGSFEENGNYYLVIEYMPGKSLASLIRKKGKQFNKGLTEGKKGSIKFLGYIAKITSILETLHKYQIVHRDATSANFLIGRFGKVSVIDMELSYSMARNMPNPPFQLGTHGFMSPQQEATMMPTIHEDIYSIGAILLSLWTGISPNKITYCSPEELELKAKFFIPDKQVAGLVIECLQSDLEKRPSLQKIRETILRYQNDLTKRKSRLQNERIFFQREDSLEVICKALTAYRTSLFVDEEKGWFSENTKKEISDKNTLNKTWYAGFYHGCSGIIYLLSKLKGVGINISALSQPIGQGLNLIEKKYILNEEEPSSGLYYGGSGVASALILAMENGIIDSEATYWNWVNRLLSAKNNHISIMQGISGHSLALISYMKRFGNKEREEQIRKLAQELQSRQEPNGSWQVVQGQKNGRVIYGFGHGMAGIIYALLEIGHCLKDSVVFSAAERGLNHLKQEALNQKGHIAWKSFSGKKLMPWWCEGAPGIALTFMKGWLYLGNPDYKKIATEALRTHPEEVYDYNFSQCHGLSGLGEIYLEAFRTFKDEEWFQRAKWIVQVLMHMKRHHPRHGLNWLVEGERHPTAGFMTGNSGILHFLLRFCHPEKFGMPLIGDLHHTHLSNINTMSVTSLSKI